MHTAHTQKGMTKLIPIIVVVAAIIAGGAYYTLGKTKQVPAVTEGTPVNTEGTPSGATPPSAGITVNPATASLSGYKDGTYSAEGSYDTPEGGRGEKLTVTLVIKDGVVTDSTLLQTAADQKSVLYQEVFASGYKEFVTGKKISDVHIDVVSGSSLTGKGFNEAVAKIATQAKA
jgi:uncharacterized protein with FMN-binding domain